MKYSYRSVMTDKHLENGLRFASTSIKVNLKSGSEKNPATYFTKIKSYCYALIVQLRLFVF